MVLNLKTQESSHDCVIFGPITGRGWAPNEWQWFRTTYSLSFFVPSQHLVLIKVERNCAQRARRSHSWNLALLPSFLNVPSLFPFFLTNPHNPPILRFPSVWFGNTDVCPQRRRPAAGAGIKVWKWNRELNEETESTDLEFGGFTGSARGNPLRKHFRVLDGTILWWMTAWSWFQTPLQWRRLKIQLKNKTAS